LLLLIVNRSSSCIDEVASELFRESNKLSPTAWQPRLGGRRMGNKELLTRLVDQDTPGDLR
jgi:hypothetical protein